MTMTVFVELPGYAGVPVWLNPAHIAEITAQPGKGGSLLFLTRPVVERLEDDTVVECALPPSAVVERIREAERAE